MDDIQQFLDRISDIDKKIEWLKILILDKPQHTETIFEIIGMLKGYKGMVKLTMEKEEWFVEQREKLKRDYPEKFAELEKEK